VRSPNQTKNNYDITTTSRNDRSIHVGLAAMGVGIGVGLTGLGMATAVGRIPAPSPRS